MGSGRLRLGPMETRRLDAVVVGAGSAGAAVAWQLARRGLRVAAIDRRPLERCGARWVNGIPIWTFDEADVPRPEPPELRGEGGTFLLLGKEERGTLRLPGAPPAAVDMRKLVSRLHGACRSEGVELWGGVRIRDLDLRGERPAGLVCGVVRGGGGREDLRLEADLFVDASGMRGALRERVPVLAGHCPRVPLEHSIVAVHQVCDVDDLAGLEAFLAHLGARPGDSISWVGVGAGLSTVAVRTDEQLSEVELLAGVGGTDGVTTAPRLMAEFVGRESWVGARRFGGSGTIPVRRPYDRLGAEGIALVGNAACQVFPAHGSGVGMGLVAGRLLAQAVTTYGDPGAAAATWDYQARFQRKFGSMLASYDVFRRLSNRISGADVDAMLAAGLIESDGSRAAIDQRMTRLRPAMIGRTVLGSLRAPRLAARMAPALARMQRVRAAYLTHPTRPDPEALRRWSHRIAALFDEPPDIP